MRPRADRLALSASAFIVIAMACARRPLLGEYGTSMSTTGIETSILLIGDAGAVRIDGDPVLAALSDELTRVPARSLTVFLGDNVYAADITAASGTRSRDRAVARLVAQASAARAAGDVVFVPGNHDWVGRGFDGWDGVRQESAVLDQIGGAQMMPRAGCPGPAVRDVGRHLRLLYLDTEWWLRGTPPPRERDGCSHRAPDDVVAAIRVALRDAADRRVIVVGHHPPVSAGPHAGHFTWVDHLFPLRGVQRGLWLPLPVVGSVYPIARMLGNSPQDQASAVYQQMIGALREAFLEHPPALFVAGHEHQLGVFRGDVIGAGLVLVSGAGSVGNTSAVGHERASRFAVDMAGFMRLDVLDGGHMRLRVIGVRRDGTAHDLFIMRVD